jgi:hypothetical protein
MRVGIAYVVIGWLLVQVAEFPSCLIAATADTAALEFFVNASPERTSSKE